MAGITALFIDFEFWALTQMAFRAGHRRQVEVELMMDQAKIGAGMVEMWQGCLRRIEILPAVIRMAGSACSGRRDLAMHASLTG